MPVVLVHGVNTRDRTMPERFAAYVNRYVAQSMGAPPAIAPLYSYWGDLGAQFRFGGVARPRTRYLAQGAGGPAAPVTPVVLAELITAIPAAEPQRRPDVTPTGYVRPGGRVLSAPTMRLGDLGKADLSDYLIAVAELVLARDASLPLVVIAIDEAIEDDDLSARLRQCPDVDAEIDVLLERIRGHLGKLQYVAQGEGPLSRFADRVREGLSRAVGAPGYAVSSALAELRPRLDTFLEQFVGDVLVYLDGRSENSRAAPDDRTDAELDALQPRLRPALAAIGAGPIQRRFILDLIKAEQNRAGTHEPLLLISHSMGGQLAYDALSWFLPRLREHVVEAGEADLEGLLPYVDFWAATASQVGLFEELGLFLSSDRTRYRKGRPVPFPADFLGRWWNVWDHNDLLSYSVRGIIDGVDDGAFDSGRSVLGAHGTYLERPSFYRMLATKVAQQKDRK